MAENVDNMNGISSQNNSKESNQSITNPVSFRLSSTVFEFTQRKWKELAGLSIPTAYQMVAKGDGIVLERDKNALQQIENLLVALDNFMPLVPMTDHDVKNIKAFVAKWRVQLKHIKKQLQRAGKPIYLYDEVKVLLKKQKVKVKYHEVMLEWYLSRFGGDNMTPENVVQEVIRHDATDWSKIKPLAKDKKYSIRNVKDTPEAKADVLEAVLWIYQIKAGDVDKELGGHLENDFKVMKEFSKWRDNEPRDYEYRNAVQGYIDRLQTITPEKIFDGVDDPQKEEVTEQKSEAALTGIEQDEPTVKEESAVSYRDDDPEQPEMEPVEPESSSLTVDVEELYEQNRRELMSFMTEQSEKLRFGEIDIKDTDNLHNIRIFAKREDFNGVFKTPKDNIDKCRTFGNAMQYIRNVINEGQAFWSMEPVRR